MVATFNELKALVGGVIAKQIIMEYFSYSMLEYSLARANIINPSDKTTLLKIANEYKNGTPLQYIFGKTYIKGLEFKTVKGVLIPRSDTEILIDLATNYINKFNIQNVLEIGFGSGIISILLALNTKAKINACDINKKALKLALENAKIHEINSNFFLADFNEIDFKNYDLIVSNPPYISTKYKLDKSVLKEPKTALYGGKKGHEILEKIIKKCNQENVKSLICEFGYDQKEILSKILSENNYKANFYKDLNGYNRAFIAERIENEKF